MIDLSTTAAGLVLDDTDRGAGVEVFQPFQIVKGADALVSVPDVADERSQVRLEVAELAPSQAIIFTIDLGNTRDQRQITVSGSVNAGASVSFFAGRR